MKKKPFVLLILDGWGVAPEGYPDKFNAVSQARLPVYRGLLERYPNTTIKCSGNDVGLPDGVMGNSEVGHMNIGAGRIVWQEITRIDKAIEKDDFKSIEPIYGAIERARKSGKRLHLMGLVSDGAVHSMDRHYFAILRLAKAAGLRGDQVAFHIFTDGRDTPPKSGKEYVKQIQDWMKENGTGVIATVSGRYYGMDRDKRWDRTKIAYDALVNGKGVISHDPVEAVQEAYDAGENDEFIKPRIIVDANNKPLATIDDGDEVISFNYRADRARQMSRAFVEPGFKEFETKPMKIDLVTMTQYIDGLPARVAFPPQLLKNTLGEVVSNMGGKQLRIAETEKYPHVSFFFSGGQEKEFPGESRILIPSPKEVATYDLKPEMSAPPVAEKLAEEIRSGKYDLIVCNFANADMVGHSGYVEASIKACEAVDAALAKVIAAIKDVGGVAIVTADHGNAEQLWDFESNSPLTQHTTNPVPLIVVDDDLIGAKLRSGGRICDVAPTILDIMGVKKPADMEGESLIEKK